MGSQAFDEDFEQIIRASVPNVPAHESIRGDLDLVALGLDSIGMVGMVSDLEDRYGIRIPDQLLTPSSFATPRAAWDTLLQAGFG